GRAGAHIELLVISRRVVILTEHLDDRQRYAGRLHLAVGPARGTQPIGSPDLEPHEIVGVVGHAHLVGIGVAHAHPRRADGRWLVAHARVCTACVASARSVRVAASGSGVPKMAWPATKIVAPAAAMASMFVASTPPSTSIGALEPAADSTART